MHKDERGKNDDYCKHSRNTAAGKRGINKRRRKANKVISKNPENKRGKE